jgi:hypothetical protein
MPEYVKTDGSPEINITPVLLGPININEPLANGTTVLQRLVAMANTPLPNGSPFEFFRNVANDASLNLSDNISRFDEGEFYDIINYGGTKALIKLYISTNKY